MFDTLRSAHRQAQRKKAYQMIDEYITLMMQDANALQQYLNVQSRFDCYSVSNAILIAAQYPQASQLKTASEWKACRAAVHRNAVRITILQPGKPYRRHDGSTGIYYDAKTVIDISQTAADREAPEPQHVREAMSALIYASPTDIQISDDLHGMTAQYDKEQGVIFVQRGLGDMQMFTGIAQAAASAVYDREHDESPESSAFQCYCAAYMLSCKYGMDVSDFHFEAAKEELKDCNSLAFKVQLNSIRTVFLEMNRGIRNILCKRQKRGDASE